MTTLNQLLELNGVAAAGGGRGVFVETAQADFNQLFAALIGER